MANSLTTYGSSAFLSAPHSVDVPVFWLAVMGFSSGFNRAVMEAVPPAIDLRQYVYALRDARIQDPRLIREVNDFYRDCFTEARSKYLRERPSSAAVNTVLVSYGVSDPDWIGSHLYQSIAGYYDTLRADSIREGYPWSQLRDVEWTVADHPIFGKPYCNEWWLGIRAQLLTELSDIDLVAAAAEPAWDVVFRQDAVIQAALLNSPPRWTTRGYDFAYGNLVDFAVTETEERIFAPIQNFGQQGLAAYGLGKTSATLATVLRIVIEAAPMMQALVLMGLYALLPFFILMSRYKFSLLILGAMILFIVKFWTVLDFLPGG